MAFHYPHLGISPDVFLPAVGFLPNKLWVLKNVPQNNTLPSVVGTGKFPFDTMRGECISQLMAGFHRSFEVEEGPDVWDLSSATVFNSVKDLKRYLVAKSTRCHD